MTPSAIDAADMATFVHGLLVQIFQGKWVTVAAVNLLCLHPHRAQ